MYRLLVPLLLAAAPALAQSPSEVLDPDTCAAYMARDMDDRVAMLTALEPLGDDIDASDEGAAREWSNEVAKVCEREPGQGLSAAAATALDTLE